MTKKGFGQCVRSVETTTARRAHGARPVEGPASEGAAAHPSARPGDVANLTNPGALVGDLEKNVPGAPAVNVERVRALKESLAAGTYVIDDRKIADNLLEVEPALAR